MTQLPPDKGYQYVSEDRTRRATRFAEEIDKMIDLRGARVLDVGCHKGEITNALAERHSNTEVVGIDISPHAEWESVSNKRLSFLTGDISQPHSQLAENSFDRIVSISVWEHIRHPWSALQNCAKYLKPNGKFYLFSMLYRSAGASHMIHRIEDRWPHLLFRPEQIMSMLNISSLGGSYWCNKLTYQQYIYYFRRLGFHITYERFNQDMFSSKTFEKYEDELDLYPMWDLKTDFFRVVLEFDSSHPKQPIPDPIYRLERK